MLEIDVSFLIQESEAHYFSASQAELGPDAGKITWRNALEASSLITLTPEEIREAKDYIKTWGMSDSDEDIDAWTDVETKAVIIQSAAADFREVESLCTDDEGEIDWEVYEALANEGTISGNLFLHEGRLYLSFCG